MSGLRVFRMSISYSNGWHFIPLFSLLLCQDGAVGFVLEDTLAMEKSVTDIAEVLFVEPQKVLQERTDFVQKLRLGHTNKRSLYEAYLEVIGANGILDGIEQLWPKCHSQAHDLGKVIFARVRDIGTSLRICDGRCHSGCMHGVLMEAFASTLTRGEHADLAILSSVINDLCSRQAEMLASYSPGDCAHGVGHALMFLADYHIPDALRTCAGFADPAMTYYCATGAYMEYVTERDRTDAVTRSLFYPCDISVYPAACFRYKMVHVAARHYRVQKTPEGLIHECEKLQGKFRRGCFHGLGNAHMPMIAQRRISLKTVCLSATDVDQRLCIEGAMERLAKYYANSAASLCMDLPGESQDICLKPCKTACTTCKRTFPSIWQSEWF